METNDILQAVLRSFMHYYNLMDFMVDGWLRYVLMDDAE